MHKLIKNRCLLTALLTGLVATSVVSAATSVTKQKTAVLERRDFVELKRAADQGNPQAQYELGLRYYRGNAAPHSLKEAITYLKHSLKGGYHGAKAVLGTIYFNKGVMLEKADKKLLSLEYYKRAQEHGVKEAAEVIDEITRDLLPLTRHKKMGERFDKEPDVISAASEFIFDCLKDMEQVRKTPDFGRKPIRMYFGEIEVSKHDRLFHIHGIDKMSAEALERVFRAHPHVVSTLQSTGPNERVFIFSLR